METTPPSTLRSHSIPARWVPMRPLKQAVKNLWGNLPVFRDSMSKIPTLHVPMNKELIKKSLQDGEFMVGSMKAPGIYRYNP